MKYLRVQSPPFAGSSGGSSLKQVRNWDGAKPLDREVTQPTVTSVRARKPSASSASLTSTVAARPSPWSACSQCCTATADGSDGTVSTPSSFRPESHLLTRASAVTPKKHRTTSLRERVLEMSKGSVTPNPRQTGGTDLTKSL